LQDQVKRTGNAIQPDGEMLFRAIVALLIWINSKLLPLTICL